MPGVTKKTKQKTAVKASPVQNEKKFISESLENKKPKKGSQKKTPKHRKRGVMYIKHLPHGFYEDQLRGYLSQFGAITRLRLARSPKTLGSKGYAFIEFRYPEVAEIAADAMNNYLMFKNIIKTRYIPPSEIKHDYFRSSVKKVKRNGEKVLTSKAIEAREAVVLNTNKLMTEQDEKTRNNKIGSKITKQKQKLAALGVDYDLDEVAPKMSPPSKASTSTAEPSHETEDTEKLDIDSDDEFEDFEYSQEDSDDDDDNDKKLQAAMQKARKAKKTAKIDEPMEKRKMKDALEVPAKKGKGVANEALIQETQKLPEKAEENKTPARKGKKVTANKKPAEAQEPVQENQAPVGKKAAGRNANKNPIEKRAPAGKEPAPPTTVAPVKSSKRIKAQVEVAPVETVPEQTRKNKKGKVAPTQALPVVKATPKKAPQKTVPVESPQPAKTKKFAKSSVAIEKKKPAEKTDVKKMKFAAKAATSIEGAETVKVVKAKEVKGKKKAAKK